MSRSMIYGQYFFILNNNILRMHKLTPKDVKRTSERKRFSGKGEKGKRWRSAEGSRELDGVIFIEFQ